MIFFIYGTDHYCCQEKLKELKDGFMQKRDKGGFNVINLDGEEIGLDQLKQEIMTTPFLSEKKMVVVKNIFQSEKKIEKPLAEFLKERENKTDNIVCFVDFFNPQKIKLPPNKKISLAGPLFKYLASQKFVWEFNLMNNLALNHWLKKYLANREIKIENEAIRELALLAGNDLNNLVSEIDKLTAYRNGQIIRLEDVKTLTNAKFDENIFNLIDALSQKNKKLALKLTSDQLNSGVHELSILKMINRQFKILLQVKSGANNSTLCLHPFVFKKALGQVKNFTPEKLVAIFKALIELESQLKTGHKNPELLLDLFIAKNCS
ncbi:DNA polymerase III subunit delta [Candidatus Falkowbacteria bacterium]|nr:DNA polymerase III subunit delta [Candidatus Falkowbacteria bacterium]